MSRQNQSSIIAAQSNNFFLEEILEKLRNNLRRIIVEHGVKSIGLFGSIVRNEATLNSPVDILVEFFKPHVILKMTLGLEDYLEDLLGRKINLKVKSSFPNEPLPPELIILEDIDLEAIRVNPEINNPYNIHLINREEVIKKIKLDLNNILKKYPLESIELFGSVARNESIPNSDVDILVEFTETVSLLKISSLINYLEDLLGNKVDVGEKDCLREAFRPYVEEDLIKIL